jgi:hypothetical protein
MPPVTVHIAVPRPWFPTGVTWPIDPAGQLDGGKLPARKGCFEHEIRNGPLPFLLILLMFNTVCG